MSKDAQISGNGQKQLPAGIIEELNNYAEWIKKYRSREIGDIKMQKIRLQLGTYAQRQEGVQMQRIKLPGGRMSSDQLIALADAADKFGSGFIHFTTRQDAQLYYIELEKCPDMMQDLARAGITTREACGNTVRNITASYRSGMAPDEAFDVLPYAEALYRFLVRNKYNQVMGRKFKIAFESCQKDYSGMLFHDFGFQAVIKKEAGAERRGFKVWVAGGLGATQMLGHVYTDFLPEEELMNLSAATVRIFDRHGERKNRMAARMKYLARKLGWEKLKNLIDEERKEVKLDPSVNDYLKEINRNEQAPEIPQNLSQASQDYADDPAYQEWLTDNVVPHKYEGFAGVHVRLKLGDITAEQSRSLAEIAETFSRAQIRISIEQNLFLPWVPKQGLMALYEKLKQINLHDAGAETIEDVTTCPGADTCRLGITSAKGLGTSISDAMQAELKKYKDLAKDIKVKISGCPNGCAQHAVANIGFQGAAVKKDGKTVPSHELYLGGSVSLDETTSGSRYGKFPARNCPKVVGILLELYSKEKSNGESFNACIERVGQETVKKLLEPLTEVPSFEDHPEFYEDWGHPNESFAVRTGIKGECAGAPVQEKAPIFSDAKEKIAQAQALLKHKEYESAQIEAYEAAVQAARVPLYANLVDPFNSEQTLWEYENIFVRAGRTDAKWLNVAERFERDRQQIPDEAHVQAMIDIAKEFLTECERMHAELQ